MVYVWDMETFRSWQASLLLPVVSFVLVIGNGCAAVGPDYAEPKETVPEAWHATRAEGIEPAAPDPEHLGRWWDAFGDHVLGKLVDDALLSNLDLDIAKARIREARARRNAERANLFFTLDASGSLTRTGKGSGAASQSSTLYSTGLDARWEIDIFGLQRRSLEAAQADLETAQEALGDALVTLTAEIGLNYFELRSYQARLNVAQANLSVQEESYRLATARYEAGLADALDVERARSTLENTRAGIPSLRASIESAMNRLCILSGKPPGTLDADLSPAMPVPKPPESVAVGVPADLIRRRPDIRKAQREIASQCARVGIAVSQLYPQLTLTGSIGFEALDASDLFTSGARSYSYGPRLSIPLFHAGALRSAVEEQDAKLEQARITYVSTILAALEEAENALEAYAQEKERNKALKDGVDAARNALAIAKASYESGRSDISALLDAERTLLATEDALAESDAAIAMNLVRLYKAMGGGWKAPSAGYTGDGPDKES